MIAKLLVFTLTACMIASENLDFTGGAINNELAICSEAAEKIKLFEDPLYKDLHLVSCKTQLVAGVNLTLGLAKEKGGKALCELVIFIFLDGEHFLLKDSSPADCHLVLAGKTAAK